jgi:hypothetical protein
MEFGRGYPYLLSGIMTNAVGDVDEERPTRGNYDNRMTGKGERYKITLMVFPDGNRTNSGATPCFRS